MVCVTPCLCTRGGGGGHLCIAAFGYMLRSTLTLPPRRGGEGHPFVSALGAFGLPLHFALRAAATAWPILLPPRARAFVHVFVPCSTSSPAFSLRPGPCPCPYSAVCCSPVPCPTLSCLGSGPFSLKWWCTVLAPLVEKVSKVKAFLANGVNTVWVLLVEEAVWH